MKRALVYLKPESQSYLRIGKRNKLGNTLKLQGYSVSYVPSLALDETLNYLKKKINHFDLFVIIGGDGTLNVLVNLMQDLEWKGKVLFFNDGTIGDAGKRFGIKKSFNQNLSLFKSGKDEHVLLGKAVVKNQTRHFTYSLAAGVFSDIPWMTSDSSKKWLGKMGYYLEAVPRVIEEAKYHFTLKTKGQIISQTSPFIIFLLGERMGGFRVIKPEHFDENSMIFLYPKTGFWNGLLSFFPFKKSRFYRIKEASFAFDNEQLIYTLDGEKWLEGPLNISTVTSSFTLYVKNSAKPR